MVRRRNKGTKAREADSGPSGQLQGSQASQKPKPATASTASAQTKTDLNGHAASSTSDRAGRDTPVETKDKHTKKLGDEAPDQRDQSRSGESGGRNRVRMPQLELPEGYTPPNRQAKNKSQSKRRRPQKSKAAVSPQVSSPSPEPPLFPTCAESSQVNNRPQPRMYRALPAQCYPGN